ncbi:MAG: Si-specific NAD(P)(+) transhydrogenase [Zetaproteobacteria bacterium]|nr:Si-specific NAD(P)(+) transhydrogenase [Zetaproteobacteria bacterium]
MDDYEAYDVVVIGSGPGGEGAAMQAAKAGCKVAVVERYARVGGACTHLGTIPSKTLRNMAHRFMEFQNEPLFHAYLDQSKINFPDFLRRSESVIAAQVKMRSGHYTRNDIEVIHGTARIQDRYLVEVDRSVAHKPTMYLRAKYIVLATGSRPHRPADFANIHRNIYDSDTVLNLKSNPRVVTIYGAGVVGCEYTSIFKTLGKKVYLINTKNSLLDFLDCEIRDALTYHLRDQGVIIRNGEKLTGIDCDKQELVLHLESDKKIYTDILLFATGRIGNTENLGLENVGLSANSRGHITVNAHYQTNTKNIYAVGDITGFPSLASSAYDQGRFAARHLIDPNCSDCLVKDVPVGIYTSPEISCLGKTEEELTHEKIPYEVGHASFRHLARAQICDNTTGMLKLLFHRDSLEILGIHCFGRIACEIVHIGQVVMSNPAPHNTLKYFVNTTFNYPTMAEAYRVAALNGLNRVRLHSDQHVKPLGELEYTRQANLDQMTM